MWSENYPRTQYKETVKMVPWVKTCWQARQPEFDPWNLCRGREEQTPENGVKTECCGLSSLVSRHREMVGLESGPGKTWVCSVSEQEREGGNGHWSWCLVLCWDRKEAVCVTHPRGHQSPWWSSQTQLSCWAGKGKGVWEGDRLQVAENSGRWGSERKDLSQFRDFRNQDGGM